MSVMILPAAHINALTTWAAHHAGRHTVRIAGQWLQVRDARAEIARALHSANAQAFTARYAEPVDVADFRPALVPAAVDMTAGQVWSMISALAYNCDEAPDWATSEARGIFDALREICAQSLPGISSAEGVVSDAQHVAQLARRRSAARAAC